MLKAYFNDDNRLLERPLTAGAHPIWIDLLNPTKQEEAVTEDLFHIAIPTREEMQEIEISSRLYTENGCFYMTATLPENADGDHPIMMPVTFVLAHDRLVTVRYHEPSAFKNFPERAEQADLDCKNAESILAGLLENIVDRLADVLERAGHEIVDIGKDIFHPSEKRVRRRERGFQIILRRIGRKESLISNIQESLQTMHRVSLFLEQAARAEGEDEVRRRVKTLGQDIQSLGDHATALSQKIIFMLDATLGMIGIEQSNIIKIVSVAAVIFLPPTLIASNYGMNFEHMPELKWFFGYPFAVGLMIMSAVLPAWIFRRMGWI
ncbi:magnesium transporter [Mesorhizobium albiziae]|uniref:Magnesium transport protein CorA n=1 Tax=Neomesorhizobium albiziae TaxID=335020 RepID=A0A1I3UZ88_9HYPH|nr:magnesium transporter CorA family protein [Mesorhizobium albiziae]GLS28578.1 magnesium transport protein CorA [Mesorhizobium albiziae]SFJ88528.1 magnesium transporter [Mesorhizobium albiziae]